MTRRMWMAVIALLGLCIATYLALYKLGYIGSLVCTAAQTCETVQASGYAKFLHVPVALWGVGYYALVFVCTIVGVQERFENPRPLALATLLLTTWGVIFSARLTYLEGFVIHAWCWWCVGSATLATLLFAIAVVDWKATNDEAGDPEPG